MDTSTRPTITRWDRRRDKYGRAIYVALTAEGGEYGPKALVGVVVKMPAAWTKNYPNAKYLVNCWGKGPEHQTQLGEVTYHPTLNAAKAHFAENALTREEHRR